jgi:hypothetical protein
MTLHAFPHHGADLVAKLTAARLHCDDRAELILWMVDFMRRFQAAQDRFDATASLVEYCGLLHLDDGVWLDDLQSEWARLRLALRLARSARR